MGTYTNGGPSPSNTANDQQKLARKVIRDLAAFVGIAAQQLAARPRRAVQQQNRTFYRKAPTDRDLEAGVLEVGIDRWLAAADRVTKPRCEATGEMFVAANGGTS